MNIDLTNPTAKDGAVDALKILIKSKKEPIIVGGNGGKGGNGGLIAPRNTKSADEPSEPQALQSPPEGTPTGTSVTKITDQPTEGTTGTGSNSGGNSEEQKRINNFKNTFGDEKKNTEGAKEVKQEAEAKAEEKEKAKEAEERAKLASLTGGYLGTFTEFEDDLYDAIATQVIEYEKSIETYRRGPNPSYAWGTDRDPIMPRDTYETVRGEKPIIYLFFDQSVSFGQADIQRGLSACASLSEFEEDDLCTIVPYFFANHLVKNPRDPRIGRGGTAGFPEVMQEILNAQDLPLNERCTNVVVISDSDIERQTRWQEQPTIILPGCVWWLWKDSSLSESAKKHLTGEQGNFQYKF